MIESTSIRTWIVIGFVAVGVFFLAVGTIGPPVGRSQRRRPF